MKKQVITKYSVSWIVLLPIKGKSTKRDVALLNKKQPLGGYGIVGVNNFMIAKLFQNKTLAKKEIKSLKGLGKMYRAYIITDAQFGSMKIDYRNKENHLFITNKQKKESKIIK